MLNTSGPSLAAGLWRVYAVSRPYSSAYLALCCLCGLLGGSRLASTKELLLAVFLVPAFTLAAAALNDLAHWQADQQAGRSRSFARPFLLSLGVSFMIVTLSLAALAGRNTLWWMLASLALGIFYGLVKRVPLLANVIRGTTSAALVLASGAMSGLNSSVAQLALGVGLLDAAGNIWGDLRDEHSDRAVGFRTIAVVSERAAVAAALLLQGGASWALTSAAPEVLPLSLFGPAITIIAPRRQAHLWFLILKYATLGVITMELTKD